MAAVMDIFKAIDDQSCEIVRSFLKEDLTLIEARDCEGRTLLHRAFRCGAESTNVYLVKLIIAKGASVNARDPDGLTPLHKVCEAGAYYGTVDMVTLLLNKGASVDACSNGGCTSLHFACSNKYGWMDFEELELIELLINAGSNVNAENDRKETPLHLACKYIRTSLPEEKEDLSRPIEELLIKHGANVNLAGLDGVTPLHIATAHNDFGLTKLLLEHGANANAKTNSPQIIPLDNYYVLNVAKGATPLHLTNSLRLAKLLIDHGAGMNEEDHTGKRPPDLHPEIYAGNFFPASAAAFD